MRRIVGVSSLMLMALLIASAPCICLSQGDAKKGQEIFESLTCIDCHKGGGNSVKPSKSLKGDSFSKKYNKDEKIEKVIRKGVAGASMPGFGKDVISDEQMVDLIAYIRSLTPAASSSQKGKVVKVKAGK